ncbi:unnamed protein product [Schistosoma curassoni]|uniref:Uncharacterized protein n=1 Tax=Schistosoma curassoni TaxID=6186 RepID=A0A183JNV7_9TREM|nr:unnamed protein product [Schistosoma curassoni]
MAKAFLEISEMERASHALILADGLTGILIFTHKSYKATLLLNIYYLNHFTSTINDTLTSFLLELYQLLSQRYMTSHCGGKLKIRDSTLISQRNYFHQTNV